VWAGLVIASGLLVLPRLRADASGEDLAHFIGRLSAAATFALLAVLYGGITTPIVDWVARLCRSHIVTGGSSSTLNLGLSVVKRSNVVTAPCPQGKGVGLRVDVFTSVRSEVKSSLCIGAH
jgi:hypothetical protein